jgi:hypothetical protein
MTFTHGIALLSVDACDVWKTTLTLLNCSHSLKKSITFSLKIRHITLHRQKG